MILRRDSFPKEEFLSRIKKHQSILNQKDIDFSIIQYKSDLYYYSGTGQSCILVIPRDEEPILFARRVLERIYEETAIEDIVPLSRTKDILPILKERGINVQNGLFGLESDIIPADIYFKYKNIFSEKKVVSISQILRKIRSIKSQREIKVLKKSAKILDEIHQIVPNILQEGLSEIEISGRLYAEQRKRGVQTFVRSRDFYSELGGNGVVLSGKNTGIQSFTLTATAGPGLHQSYPFGSSEKKIQKNELILVDMSISYKGYITDETRCYVIGKVPQKIKKRYEIAYSLEQKLASLLKEGNKIKDVYNETYAFAKKLDVDKYLMLGGEIPFLAHGVGLELNDLPVITKKNEDKLSNRNVVAVEPKLIYPREMAIGSENTYIVTTTRTEQITNAPQPLLE
ncbi:MAG: M24 family metallopeptidase [Candidatus Heimdallarchaeaceae archaeon]